ncbi:sugar-binding transcriptional regulator [Trueperella pecoris]|uniref:sugar-binding transcriptional regulator n=1 Tax=Trueperella pecoris TaxID=2733571 RepID=UPI001FE48FA8|nr:sugar-binding domain-containing protein [Trueperella pecoris]
MNQSLKETTSMNRQDRSLAAYEAAVMHFVQGETMESIARRLSVSRSTVSRLIAEAKDEGLVQVTIHPPEEAAGEMQARIAQMFNVRVKVVPVPFGVNETRRLNAVAQVAGITVSNLMKPDTIIGLAWGNTVAAIVDHLVPRPARGSIAVQLNGAANASTTGVPYAGSLMEAFGKAFGAAVQYFAVPAFFDFAATREALWRERSINAVREVQQRADIALFGIGSLTSKNPSMVYSGGYLSEGELEKLREDGVVGDICTVLLRGDGSWEDLEINSRASGPTPTLLRQIPQRIGVVSGADKIPATVAALLAGVITDLIIDEDSAELLHEYALRSIKAGK